jgi:hypothetical protein
VRFTVDAACEAAEDDEAGRGQLPPEQPSYLRAVRRAGSRSDNCDGGPTQKLRTARTA